MHSILCVSDSTFRCSFESALLCMHTYMHWCVLLCNICSTCVGVEIWFHVPGVLVSYKVCLFRARCACFIHTRCICFIANVFVSYQVCVRVSYVSDVFVQICPWTNPTDNYCHTHSLLLHCYRDTNSSQCVLNYKRD